MYVGKRSLHAPNDLFLLIEAVERFWVRTATRCSAEVYSTRWRTAESFLLKVSKNFGIIYCTKTHSGFSYTRWPLNVYEIPACNKLPEGERHFVAISITTFLSQILSSWRFFYESFNPSVVARLCFPPPKLVLRVIHLHLKSQ